MVRIFQLVFFKFYIILEKLFLRPTVDRPKGTWSNMLEQFDDSGRISQRRKRQLAEDWDIPCSSKEAARFMSHAGARITQLDEIETIQGLNEKDEEILRETYPKHCSKDDVDAIMSKFRNTKVENNVEEKSEKNWGSFDDDERPFSKIRREDEEDITFANGTGEEDDDEAGSDIEEYPKELLRSEFVSIMEKRFLAGEDDEFFDYSINPDADKIQEQDLEDAYFAED